MHLLQSVSLRSFSFLPLLNSYFYYGFISQGFTLNQILDLKLIHDNQLKSFTWLSWLYLGSGGSWLPNHFLPQVFDCLLFSGQLENWVTLSEHISFLKHLTRGSQHTDEHDLKQGFSKYGLHKPRNPGDSFSGSTSQNYFYKNSKRLFAFFTVLTTLAQMPHQQWWVKLLVP